MPTISLTDFVDFAIMSGPSQFAKVKEIASRPEYDPRFDFWKPLREAIQDFHQNGTPLESVLVGLKDQKKISRYPAAVKCYKRFIGKKALRWFKPPSQLWRYEGLIVKVNPEIGIEIEGKKFAGKLYFKDEKPTKQRLRVVFELMRGALGLSGETAPAVIDVSNSRLIPPMPSQEDLSILLEAQALAFLHIWKSVSIARKAKAAGA